MRASVLRAAVIGLAIGLISNRIIVYFRDHGPMIDGASYNGNGALDFLLLPLIALVVGIVVYSRRRDWAALGLYVVTIFLGLLVVLGSF